MLAPTKRRPVRLLITAVKNQAPEPGYALLFFAAVGVSRALTNTPPGCWFPPAGGRAVRLLITAVKNQAPEPGHGSGAWFLSG